MSRWQLSPPWQRTTKVCHEERIALLENAHLFHCFQAIWHTELKRKLQPKPKPWFPAVSTGCGQSERGLSLSTPEQKSSQKGNWDEPEISGMKRRHREWRPGVTLSPGIMEPPSRGQSAAWEAHAGWLPRFWICVGLGSRADLNSKHLSSHWTYSPCRSEWHLNFKTKGNKQTQRWNG